MSGFGFSLLEVNVYKGVDADSPDQQKPERRHEIVPEKVKKTRSGREVKIPSRYGQWIN